MTTTGNRHLLTMSSAGLESPFRAFDASPHKHEEDAPIEYPYQVSKANESFVLDKAFVEGFRDVKPPFGFDGLGELVYLRTYSRVKPDGTKEQWFETIERVVNGTYTMQKRWIEGNGLGWRPEKAQRSAQEMYERMFHLKFSPPGRGLWAMGSPLTEVKHLYAALNNCGFVSTGNVVKDPTKSFVFLMDASMLGIGVGFDTCGTGLIVVGGPAPGPVKTMYQIADSREGWVESMRLLLSAYLQGQPDVEFDYSLIRAAGEPIKTFGGIASGPDSLRNMHATIRGALEPCVGKSISVTCIVDIMNHIGVCVVSGNVRRCLPGGTLVHTNRGILPIEKVVAGDMARTSTGWARVSEMIEQGVQSLVSVQTQLGEVRCTALHRVAVLTGPGVYGWKRANELVPGDRLVFVEPGTGKPGAVGGVPTSLPPWSYERPTSSTTCKDILVPELCTEVAWFFGMLHGNGYVYANRPNNGFNAYVSVATNSAYADIPERVAAGFRMFGLEPWIRCDEEKEKCVKIGCTSKQLAWYLDQFKRPKQSLVVPDFIMCSGDPAIKASYLAGLADADGSNGRPLVAVCSVYPDYLVQVQALYASIGIPVRLNHIRAAAGNWKALYELSVIGSRTRRMFSTIVAVHSCRMREDHRLSSVSRCDFGFPMDWMSSVPKQRWHVVDGKKVRQARTLVGAQLTVDAYERFGGDKLRGLIPIEVLSVNLDCGITAETFDLSVPDGEEFVFGPGLLGHNSALIAFGNSDSSEYLDLKNYDVNPHRAAFGWSSNNSVFANLGQDYTDACERVRCNGEPGFAWLDNMRNYARMGGPEDRRDFRVMGGNPCLEQSLEPFEMCCLVETFPGRCDDKADFLRTLKFAYLYAKTVTLGRTHWPETNRVMLRNRRIGCSMSGIAQFLAKHGVGRLREWSREGYDVIQKYDGIYSDWFAIPRSIKTTSIKPSGTVSLLAGATPGMHYPMSRFYTRRVRLPAASKLVEALRASGYHLEPCVGDEERTTIVEFPIDAGEGVRPLSSVSMWEQLELAAFLQEHWADNQVSCTVTFDPEREGAQIANALDYFQYRLKGVSFLPNVNSGYAQLPYETITEEQYRAAKAKITRPLDFSAVYQGGAIVAGDEQVEKYCDGDSCVRGDASSPDVR